MMRKTLIALAGLAAVGTPASAQEQNLLDLTCGQYLTALSIAAPASGASKAAQDLAKEAQDDIAEGLIWIHGFRAGQAIAAGKPLPALTRTWLSAQVMPLAQACRAGHRNANTLLLDIVKSGQ